MSARITRGSTSSAPPLIVVIDDIDPPEDDVILSSARSFAEAKNKSRRNRSNVVVVDLDAESSPTRLNNRNTGSRVPRNQQEHGVKRQKQAAPPKPAPPPPPPPPPQEPVFNCPVCMGPLVEEVSTKCGHIFCKACIKAAVAAQSKCPTCRRKMTMKDTIRIFLPSAS